MFTGIVAGQGHIVQVQAQAGETRFTIRADFELANIVVGESIAVNGACLTVEQGAKNSFMAYASAETMSLTNLKYLKAGAIVNIERALALGDRLGGHLVSGHVDGVAKVSAIRAVGQSRFIRLEFEAEHSREIIHKGSITLDGISLTVNECGPGYAEVNVIPETWRVTTIAQWQAGTLVNLETDVIGKYVGHMLTPYQAPSKLNLNFLQEHGFV